MQYLTIRWSGRWHNLDLCFAGIGQGLGAEKLLGIHYAGIKPWNIKNPSLKRVFARYEDYRIWYGEFSHLVRDYPGLWELGRIKRLGKTIEEWNREGIIPRFNPSATPGGNSPCTGGTDGRNG